MICFALAGTMMSSVRAVQQAMMTLMNRSCVITAIVSVSEEIVAHHQVRVKGRHRLCGGALLWWLHGLPRVAVLGTRFLVPRRTLLTNAIPCRVLL
jgi:hypothetical protein